MGCGPCACHGGCQWFIAKICLQALFVGVVRYDGRDTGQYAFRLACISCLQYDGIC